MAILAIPLPTGELVDEHGVKRTVQRSFINATAQGNTQLVAAQGTLGKIRVMAVNVISATALTVKLQSGTTDISSGKVLAANSGWIAPNNDHGWYQTAANEALNVNLSVAGTVGIDILWVQGA